MCGRYTLTKLTDIQGRFQVSQAIASTANPRYNAAPSQQMPVVLQDKSEVNELELLQWGLIPFWSKEPKATYSTINARAEGIESKPAYRRPIRSQRCIIPADGFFEWKKEGKAKLPHYIHLKSGDLFGFAGLYDVFKHADGSLLKTFTIITTEANEIMQPIHNRMPVILPAEAEAEWLDYTLTDPFQVLRLLKPYPSELLEIYPVSREVNKPSNDVPELVKTLNSA